MRRAIPHRPEGVHPLIKGLVRELPVNGKWSREEAEKWLAVAAAAFEVIYEFEAEPDGSER